MSHSTLFPDAAEGLPVNDGILPSQALRGMIRNGIISAASEFSDDQIQPASIDLRLSSEAYRVRASFLPGKSTTLITKATNIGMLEQSLDISEPTVLEPGRVYIIPLMESLTLPENIYGIANPKSTTGRLDIFTRLITEHGDEFDRVRRGYRGRLYVEVLSQTFRILVQAGMRLNQLRFGRGRFAPAGDRALKELDQRDYLIHDDDDAIVAPIDRGVRITIDLEGNGSDIVGYQALPSDVPIDLNKLNFYHREDFWRPIRKNADRSFVLEPSRFYILASKQRVRVSPDHAAELLPYDLATQEFRVHYAGFFDPGFGFGLSGEIPGTRAVLEVRASQMPILLEDDQFVGRLNYFVMASTPDKIYGGPIGSSYQKQGLALSKQFKSDELDAFATQQRAETRQLDHKQSALPIDEDEDEREENGRKIELRWETIRADKR